MVQGPDEALPQTCSVRKTTQTLLEKYSHRFCLVWRDLAPKTAKAALLSLTFSLPWGSFPCQMVKPTHQVQGSKAWRDRPQVERRKAGEKAQTQGSLPKLLYLSQPHKRRGWLLGMSFRSCRPHRVVSDLKLGTLRKSHKAFTPHNPVRDRWTNISLKASSQFLKKTHKTFKPAES